MAYCFLKLTLGVLDTIDDLPQFHGVLWSALLRFGYNLYLKPNESFHETGIIVSPADTGVVKYQRLDRIELGVALPPNETKRFQQVLDNLGTQPGLHGHFVPGKTIRLSEIHCRVSGRPWPKNPAVPLTMQDLQACVERLSDCFHFQLVLDTPLRLTRPAGHKEKQHRYCDEAFFRQSPNRCHHMLKQAVEADGLVVPSNAFDWVELEYCHGIWLDVSYHGKAGKTIGGLVGVLACKGKLDTPVWDSLIWHQWLGLGKNCAFGLGQYRIPQIEEISPLQPLVKHTTLLKSAMRVDVLTECLQEFVSPNPGPDGLTLNELTKIGRSGIKQLAESVLAGTYRASGVERFQLEKPDGGERSIVVWSLKDRWLQRAAARQLSLVIERWLSQSSFAYRTGLSRQSAKQSYQKAFKAGYRFGIKADIHAFFDSVDRLRLDSLCQGLFPREPLIPLIFRWLEQGDAPLGNADASPQGLPQGSPLSPILSNLFLDQFDRELNLYDFKLIRFADDGSATKVRMRWW